MAALEVSLPKLPECRETGGSGGGELVVVDLLVFPGDLVACDDTIIVLETGKVALDIPSPHDGRVLEVKVAPGDRIEEGQVILILEPLA